MKKYFLIAIIIFLGNVGHLFSDIDSLKNEFVLYSIKNFNQDCYKDTLYGKIYNASLILPEFIIWGVQDSSTICDTNLVNNYDSLNVNYTNFLYDSNEIIKLYVNTNDFNGDFIRDLNFTYNFLDSTNKDSVCHFLICGNNSLSRKSSIYINKDSLSNDSVNFYSPSFSNGLFLLNFRKSKVYLINDYLTPSPLIINSDELTSIEDDFKDLIIYPNPAKNTLHIRVLGVPFSYKVVDSRGKVLINSELINSKDSHLDISNLSNGSYFLLLERYSKQSVLKFIKTN